MIKLNDIIEVEIEKLTYGKEALARFGADNFVIFVKEAIPKDVLKVKITSLNKKFARAQIVEILKPSPYRTKPFCALYNACGSCNFQNCDYDFLIEQKTLILKDTFKNIIDEKNIFPVAKSPNLKEYRHKIQFPVRQTKNSKRILIGYFKENSHDLTNIKFCPMQPAIINDIAQFIRDNFKESCFDEKTNKGLLKNTLLRVSSTNCDILFTLVLNCTNEEFINFEYSILRFFDKITAQFKEIKGCFVNFNPKNTNKILGEETIKIKGNDFIIESLNDKNYKIGSSSFFQVNPSAASILFDTVKENIEPNSSILDAYGGVGAIGIFISDNSQKITLVEENENACIMAEENFKLNNVKNYEIFKGDAKEHFKNFKEQKRKFDYIIVDPPRSGCEKEALKLLSELTQNIIYVSCNPQTLKRDISYLKEDGFKPKFIKGVDLFPYTYHIESVVLLKKEV